jgi:endonuclease YncB( thermonuclease family)
VSQAAVIAAELAQDGDSYDRCVVYVTDEHGNDIGKVPVAAAMP